jgi:hypothetical protein
MEDNPLSPREDLATIVVYVSFSLICGRWTSEDLFNVHSFILLHISPPHHVFRGGNSNIKGKIN